MCHVASLIPSPVCYGLGMGLRCSRLSVISVHWRVASVKVLKRSSCDWDTSQWQSSGTGNLQKFRVHVFRLSWFFPSYKLISFVAFLSSAPINPIEKFIGRMNRNSLLYMWGMGLENPLVCLLKHSLSGMDWYRTLETSLIPRPPPSVPFAVLWSDGKLGGAPGNGATWGIMWVSHTTHARWESGKSNNAEQ